MLPLEIAARGKLNIRSESVTYFGDGAATTILYASDLHLSAWTSHVAAQWVSVVHRVHPDIVLLGGDMVDNQAGLPQLADCIRQISRLCPVWAVSGNHETYVGLEIVRSCVESVGGCWLEGRSCLLRGGRIQLDGFCRAALAPCVYSILCAHDPVVFPHAAQSGYHLVLAGHLHGSQCVLYQHEDILYPGALFFRWNGTRFHQNDTRLIVSRGVNDTFPIRWNCPREVVVCKIG